jgi:hypothetical protein
MNKMYGLYGLSSLGMPKNQCQLEMNPYFHSSIIHQSAKRLGDRILRKTREVKHRDSGLEEERKYEWVVMENEGKNGDERSENYIIWLKNKMGYRGVRKAKWI